MISNPQDVAVHPTYCETAPYGCFSSRHNFALFRPFVDIFVDIAAEMWLSLDKIKVLRQTKTMTHLYKQGAVSSIEQTPIHSCKVTSFSHVASNFDWIPVGVQGFYGVFPRRAFLTEHLRAFFRGPMLPALAQSPVRARVLAPEMPGDRFIGGRDQC